MIKNLDIKENKRALLKYVCSQIIDKKLGSQTQKFSCRILIEKE
jgi:hypothetical protein